MKKIMKSAIMALPVFFLLNTFNVASYSHNPNINYANTCAEVRSAETGWIYKTVGGKLYRRLYDYTNQKWIGEWELCP